MKLYILPDGRLLLAPVRALPMEAAARLQQMVREWETHPGDIAIFAEPLEVIDLREPKS